MTTMKRLSRTRTAQAVRRMRVPARAAGAVLAVLAVCTVGIHPAEARNLQGASAQADWFRVIDSIPGAPLAVAAPGGNEVWVALHADTGVVMARYDLQRWETTPVLTGHTPAPYSPRGPAVLQAVGPQNIWLAAAGGLAHYDGSSWREVAGPTGADGRDLWVTTVAAAPGRLYVGTRGDASGGRVWRWDHGEWVDLGGPDAGNARLSPREIKMIRGTIMVDFTRTSSTDSRGVPWVWWHDGRRWSSLYRFEPYEMFSWGDRTAWIVRDDWRHLFFGYLTYKAQPYSGTCEYAHAPGRVQQCHTATAVSSAVQLRDRSIVLAAGASPTEDTDELGRPGPDRLTLRQLDGSEATIGQAGIVSSGVPRAHLTVEPDGRTVWATTSLGLQRWVAPQR